MHYARFTFLLALAAVGPISVQLSAQGFDKVGHLYFTKPFGGADPLPQIVTVTAAGAAIEFNPTASTISGGDWLSVTSAPDCCAAPAPMNVAVHPDSALPVGSYSGQVVLDGNGNSQTVEVHLIVTPPDAATFDRLPSQLSFSMTPGGDAPSPQFMEVAGLGGGPLEWRLIGSTFNGKDFLRVSTGSGRGSQRISVEVVTENLPDAGLTTGVYIGQILFVSAGSSATVPVTVSVGNAPSRSKDRLHGNRSPGVSAAASEPATSNPNIAPANTTNCFCGGFNNQDTGYGGLTTDPSGNFTGAKLVIEANPGNGSVPHYESIYTDLGPGQHTLSFHFKGDIDTWAYITSQVDTVVRRVWFNLNTGAVGANVPAGWTTQVTSLGNGWYRCSATFTATNSAVYNGFGLATADNQAAYVGTNGNGLYEWGQQFENGPLSPYQANLAPCLSQSTTADSHSVSGGSPIGFTTSIFNQATPAVATTLTSALPAGTGLNWSINPAYSGPGTCAITGASGSQTLGCNFGSVAVGTLATVHITSATTGSSCGVYTNNVSITASTTQYNTSDTVTVGCSNVAVITSPAGGSTLGGSPVLFTWSPVVNADMYWLDVGNSVGHGDFFGASTAATQQQVSGLPCDGRTVYVQLYTHVSGTWQTPQRYTYTACNLTAGISSPTPGSVLSSTSATFTWNAASGADNYWLDVGSSVGQGDISGGSTTATSKSVTGLPCDGRTLYVQLYTHLSGAWQTPQRYTYTACNLTAGISSPTPGSVLPSSSATFTWSAAGGADNYWLDVGNSVGQGDISGGSTSATSKGVTGLPCDGRTLYVQLYTHLNGTWQTPQRYTYTACNLTAAISSPTPGSVLSSTSATFTWNAPTGADNYWLDVGNSVGQGDLSAGATIATSKSVTGLPCDGRTVYVQLYTHLNGAWQAPQRYTYTACNSTAVIISPAPSSVLASTAATFSWNAVTGADNYWLDVGNSVGQGDISGGSTTSTSKSVTALPCDSRTLFVQLYTHLNGTWLAPQRYTYTACHP